MAKGRAWQGVVAAVLTAGAAAGLAILGQRLINPGRDFMPRPYSSSRSYDSGSSDSSRSSSGYRPSSSTDYEASTSSSTSRSLMPPMKLYDGDASTGNRSAPLKSERSYGQMAIRNDCHRDVIVAFTYLDSTGSLMFSGEWQVEANRRVYPGVDGSAVRPSTDVILYTARSRDGELSWHGDRPLEIDGRTLHLKRWEFNAPHSAARELGLSCNESPAQSNAPAAAY